MSKKAEPKIERADLTQEALKSLLHYDPETGVFIWLYRPDAKPEWNTRFAGNEAGAVYTARNTQYRSIRIFGLTYQAHRLAVFYMTGEWPPQHTDHEDGDGLNNRWLNLRPATIGQNIANSRLYITNQTGFKGVRRNGARWVAEYCNKYLGSFSTAEEASRAHDAAERAKYGVFSRAA